ARRQHEYRDLRSRELLRSRQHPAVRQGTRSPRIVGPDQLARLRPDLLTQPPTDRARGRDRMSRASEAYGRLSLAMLDNHPECLGLDLFTADDLTPADVTACAATCKTCPLM